MDRGNCMIFFLLEYYIGITGLLCVISLQFIGFSLNKHSIEIWNIWGKVLKFHGGVPLIWAMPKFKQFFLCVCYLIDWLPIICMNLYVCRRRSIPRDIEPRILGSMELDRCFITDCALWHPTHCAAQARQTENIAN